MRPWPERFGQLTRVATAVEGDARPAMAPSDVGKHDSDCTTDEAALAHPLGVPTPAGNPTHHIFAIGLRVRRPLAFVPCPVAVPARSHDVRGAVTAARAASNQVLCGTSQWGWSVRAIKPYPEATVVALAALAVEGEFPGKMKLTWHRDSLCGKSPCLHHAANGRRSVTLNRRCWPYRHSGFSLPAERGASLPAFVMSMQAQVTSKRGVQLEQWCSGDSCPCAFARRARHGGCSVS